MAVLGDVQALSHAALQARIVTLRRALHAAGFGCSARVAVELPKSADLAVLLLAVASACCCVPLNPAMTRQERERVWLAGQVVAFIAMRGSAAWHQLETRSIAMIAVSDTDDALRDVPPIVELLLVPLSVGPRRLIHVSGFAANGSRDDLGLSGDSRLRHDRDGWSEYPPPSTD